MDFLYDSYISWFQFIIFAILIASLYYLAKRYKSTVTWLTGLHSLSLINAFFVIILIMAFVLINPFVHGIIVLLIFVLFFQVIRAYIKGITVTSNSKIEIGDLVRIGNNKGKVANMSLAGIKLLNEENNIYIPYKILADETIEKFNSHQATYINIFCQPEEEGMGKGTLQKLQKVIFDFPFLDFNSNIEVKQLSSEYEVHMTIANDKFKSSLFSKLRKAGFKIVQNTNENIWKV